MGSALRWAAWVLGLALIALLLRRIGLPAIRAALGRVGPRFLWMVGAYAAATAVGALPWGLLIPRGQRPPWGGVIASRFAASGVNALLPLFGAGDAGRLMWISRSAWSTGTAAIIVERLLFLVAGAGLLLAGVLAARGVGALPASFELIGGAVALAIGLGALLFALAVKQGGRLTAGVTRWARRLRAGGAAEPNGAPSALSPALTVRPGQSWDTLAAELLRGSRRRLLGGLAIHLVSRLLFALEIYAGLRALGVAAGWRETLIFASVPIALSVVGTLVPGQLGVQEAVQALVAAALGLAPSIGLAVALLQRARQLLFVPLSGLLMAFLPGRARADRS